ncbi:SDR family oxidoreductase [Novosphingobium sp. 1949]|uniref:SDR family oxidoreductase n=1 Tax=Novosphingobium organovorum TaxID=2930092 RepID=A0ABT0BDX3_9SPHN|nr:SDR family oxidoreductase [Novosphingobium organovorum]MCJ2183188.1 SDR family oxidoreductase [Novosphingobium organovorum]
MSAATQLTPLHPERRIAVVTGGSRGLGRASVEALAARGVWSIFTYNSNEAAAQEVVAAVEAAGARAAALQLDTSDTAAFPAFAKALAGVLVDWDADHFDYLVNNAGTAHHAPIEAVSEADFDALYRIHVKGVFFLTQTLLPLLADRGRIVNVSSGLTRFSFAGSAAYAAMKGAVEVMTRYFAAELGKRGITANTVAPGAIATDFSGGLVRDNPQINARIAGATALGRVGEAEDIGPMIASLLREENRWINAQRIEVSGGMVV